MDAALKRQAEDALSRAKIALMVEPKAVFYASICLSLKHIFTEDIPTAGTDGRCVYYNPHFFLNECTKKERIGLVLHEILHVAFMHALRKSGRIHKKWNAACDYVINLIIEEAGFELPKCRLLDKKYKGMDSEGVYDLLPDNECPEPDYDDLMEPDESLTPEELKEIEKEIDDILIQAAIQTKQQTGSYGSIPGDLERYIDSLINPKVPWFRLLRNFFTVMTSKMNWTFRRPNRRYLPSGHYLPTRYGTALCEIAVAVDTSGSVSQAQFTHFISEVAAILKELKPTAIHFMQFDTQIKSIDTVKNLADLKKIQFKGMGGTNVNCVMDWAIENKPHVLIMFTDGYFSAPRDEPKCPTIWIIHDNPSYQAPFGKTIHYDYEEAA